MTQVLCFRLFGPLAAWGTTERGVAKRPSQLHPSRGAVLGIICAALGIDEMNNPVEALALGDGLSIAVSSHGPRRLINEFRTSQEGFIGKGCEKMTRKTRLERTTGSTELTSRQFIEDGLWRIFLSSRANGPRLDMIAKALQYPATDISLGRREYPLALPLDPQLIYGGLSHAIDRYVVTPSTLPSERSQLHALYDAIDKKIVSKAVQFDLRWDVDFPGAPVSTAKQNVSDDPFNRRAWTFRTRVESRTMLAEKMPQMIDENSALNVSDLESEYYLEDVSDTF